MTGVKCGSDIVLPNPLGVHHSLPQFTYWFGIQEVVFSKLINKTKLTFIHLVSARLSAVHGWPLPKAVKMIMISSNDTLMVSKPVRFLKRWMRFSLSFFLSFFVSLRWSWIHCQHTVYKLMFSLVFYAKKNRGLWMLGILKIQHKNGLSSWVYLLMLFKWFIHIICVS